MTGPSDKAIEAGRGFADPIRHAALDCAVRRACPIIRADVIAEVVAKLRSIDAYGCAQMVDREFGGES